MSRLTLAELRAIARQPIPRETLDAVLRSGFPGLRFPDPVESAFQAHDAIEYARFRRVALAIIAVAYSIVSLLRLAILPDPEEVVTAVQFGLLVPGAVALIVMSRSGFGMARFKAMFTVLALLGGTLFLFRFWSGEIVNVYAVSSVMVIFFAGLFGLRIVGFRRGCVLALYMVSLFTAILYASPGSPLDEPLGDALVFVGLIVAVIVGYQLERRERLNFLTQRRLRQSEAEMRLAAERADAANRAKSQFLAKMNHELRTPLTVITGYNDLLLAEATDRGLVDLLPDLRKIHGSAEHLLALINDVIDFSKIEAGRMEIEAHEFGVAEVVREATAIAEPLMRRNGNAFVVEVDGDLGVIRSDQTKVRQILINLLSNAAKFTHNGTVALRVIRHSRDDGDRIEMKVSDTGIGMTEEQMAKLFKPFVQADASTTRRFGGTGLGLAITDQFCAMLGGSVGVESRPGVGTTFVVNLPATALAPG